MRSGLVIWAMAMVTCASVVAACGSADDVFSAAPTSDSAGGSAGDGSATGGGGSGGGSGTGGSAGTTGDSGPDGAGAGGTAGADASDGGAGECSRAADCDTLFGAAPCGAWTCTGQQCQASAAGCTDSDFDGYGVGANCACAGLDCDDADDTVGDTAAQTCYSGAPNTLNVGTCVAGTRTCTAGVWTLCSGEVTPSGEACNNLDDDCDGQNDDGLGTFTCGLGACVNTVIACSGGIVGTCNPLAGATTDNTCDGVDDNCNGAVDEGCASCVPVAPAPFGDDATAAVLANPSLATPFATIQAAIDYAVAHPSGPQTVCVAGGADCTINATYAANVVMANGVSVLGSYQTGTAGNGWRGTPAVLGARCPRNATLPAYRTRIQAQAALGVSFPSSVQSATVLDGFQIDRFAAASSSAITVDGARRVVLSNLMITANASATIANTSGINVVNGAQARVTGSHVEAGLGTVSAIGVRSVQSQVDLVTNCGTLNASGRCAGSSGPNVTSPGVRHGNGGAGLTFGVYLEDSPNSTIETTAIQMGNADQGAAVRIVGNAAGVMLRGNNMFVFDGVLDSHGVWMEDCGGAAPWIVNNEMISGNGANGQSRASGIRAIGDCHPVIDSNVVIRGGGEGNAAQPNGVHCGANQQRVPSRCVVLNNQNITGSVAGFPPVVTGIRCDGASCLRIAGNTITARGASTGYGVWLESTGAMVDDNLIRGGCSSTAHGVYSKDSYARLQNNRIFGYSLSDCGASSVVPVQSSGLTVEITSGNNELDVNGNDIDGGGNNVTCSSRGISLVAGTPAPVSGKGIFRNNIVRAGVCATAHHGLEEMAISTDPRIFENNDLDPFNTPTSLYRDENSAGLTTASAVNGLLDMTVAGNISVDALYASYPIDLHLQTGSPCLGTGTPTGAPAFDMDGDARNQTAPDIGADER